MSNEKMDRSVENIELIGPTAQHQDLAGDQSLPGNLVYYKQLVHEQLISVRVKAFFFLSHVLRRK